MESATLRSKFEYGCRTAQGCSPVAPVPSPTDPEDDGDGEQHDAVCHEEKRGGRGYHDEHHGCRYQGFAPCGPSDLLRLGAHLLHEFERTDSRHGFVCRSSGCGLTCCLT